MLGSMSTRKHPNLGIMVHHFCNLRAADAEARGSGAQGHPRVYGEFWFLLKPSYVVGMSVCVCVVCVSIPIYLAPENQNP
uniref:Uncharacterized protein n=1 Tax=Mus musculus TaxID=10090 RepID=Q3TR37_MOUSE|nr:unnamed protein product [Mus musculus]